MTWHTLREAARLLGVSDDTLRRRIQRQEVEYRRVETVRGWRWEVRYTAATPQGGAREDRAEPAAEPATAAQAQDTAQIAVLEARLAGLVRALGIAELELERRSAELERRSHEVRELHVLLRDAHGLAARQPPAAITPPHGTAEAPQPPQHRSWLRWLRWKG